MGQVSAVERRKPPRVGTRLLLYSDEEEEEEEEAGKAEAPVERTARAPVRRVVSCIVWFL